MPKKGCTYKVRCTIAIAEEMARYEGGEVVGEGTDRIPYKYEQQNWEADMSSYLFTIHTPHYNEPNRARWASFGIYDIEVL